MVQDESNPRKDEGGGRGGGGLGGDLHSQELTPSVHSQVAYTPTLNNPNNELTSLDAGEMWRGRYSH